jgi:hypothetical protein
MGLFRCPPLRPAKAMALLDTGPMAREDSEQLQGEGARVGAQGRRGGATRPAISVTVVHSLSDTVARVRGPRVPLMRGCSQ